MMKEFIQRIIDIYPLYTKRIALFERHLEARENRDMRDALTMLKIKIGLVDSLITLLEPDERFVFRQILQNSGDVSPAQQAAAIRWMWSFSQRDETFWALYERAMMRIANFKYEDESGQRYVPTLSTLTLLSILGQLEILTPCQPDMIIPESYHLFFREKFAKAAELAKSGASTLFFVDGKPVMQESDKSIPDIWGSIIEFCNGCETKEVCDEERIAFRLFNEMSGEELLAGFKLDVIQLDALILAKRENATYLCDDLFFRKVAEGLRIRNLNFVSLLQHYNDIDYIVPILMEMSKTNYIYLPLWARDSGEQNVLITNLLNGERKQMYYGSMLKAYFDEFEKMARELFGDDIVDQAKEKAKVKLIEQSSKLEK